MEVIILAGGKGTRIKSITKDKIPKPMLPVNGKPFLEYIFNWLKGENVKKVVLSIGFKGDIIKNHFKDNYNGMEIVYSDESEILLGTGGAIKKAIKKIEDNNLIVINGDTYFPISLKKLINFHVKKAQKISIGLKLIENSTRYGSVEISDNHKIIRFVEKGKDFKNCLINGGIYCLNKTIFKNIEKKIFSFEKEVLENEKTEKFGIKFEENFIDIGIPEDYEKFKNVLS